MDSSQLFEPAAAYGAGKKMFGEGILGKGAGAALVAGTQAVRAFDGLVNFGKARPSLARQVGQIVSSRQEALSTGMQNLETLKAERDMAKLNLDGAEASYRIAVKDLEEYKKAYGDKKNLETGKIVAEGNFVDALYEYERPSAPGMARVSGKAKGKETAAFVSTSGQLGRKDYMASRYEQLMRQKKLLEEYSTKEQEIAKRQVEKEQAQLARDKVTVSYAQQAVKVQELRKGLSDDVIREEFKKLRSNSNTPGDISVRWR
ncbi:MAG: hypothetical protein K6U74_12430, partial [Firmicutes bacterium]|nr:hypothetical protein [Bacillota bacterium]